MYNFIPALLPITAARVARPPALLALLARARATLAPPSVLHFDSQWIADAAHRRGACSLCSFELFFFLGSCGSHLVLVVCSVPCGEMRRARRATARSVFLKCGGRWKATVRAPPSCARRDATLM